MSYASKTIWSNIETSAANGVLSIDHHATELLNSLLALHPAGETGAWLREQVWRDALKLRETLEMIRVTALEEYRGVEADED